MTLLKGGTMKDLYEMRGRGYSIRGIARELGISWNSVRKYLRSPCCSPAGGANVVDCRHRERGGGEGHTDV